MICMKELRRFRLALTANGWQLDVDESFLLHAYVAWLIQTLNPRA